MATSRYLEQSRHHRTSGWRWKLYYTFLAISLLYILLTGLIATLTRNTLPSKRIEERQWIASSRYWLDRQLCRWIGCCGTFHMLNHAGWTWPVDEPDRPVRDFTQFWHSGAQDSGNWSHEERERRTIPNYVLDYAPYVHLFSGESYWPSDIAEHLVHTAPFLNYSGIDGLARTRDLVNLDELNHLDEGSHGRDIFLHSGDNVETLPEWLTSEYNKPGHSETQVPDNSEQFISSNDARCGGANITTCQRSGSGQCCSFFGWCGSGEAHCGDRCDPRYGYCYGPHKPGAYGPRTDLKKRAISGRGESGAPAVLVVVPKPDGIVDAFWFFFYSYNKGKTVLGIQFGDHVGDWEHTMVRFQHGEPTHVFLSAHSWGASLTYDALEKYSWDPSQADTPLSSWRNATAIPSGNFKRPVVFSAYGSHAMYETPDYHDYVAPFGILHDDTDRGPLWDPTRHFKSFTYDVGADVLRSSTLNPDAPTGWFHYRGRWGDRYYLLSDPRQYRFAGEYHYVSGPEGPKFKNLGRELPCIRPGECKINTFAGRADSPGTIHMLHEGGENAEDGD